MSRSGFVLGRRGRRILRFRGEENILLCGSARSGKGVGVIIPSLLELPGHVVIVDIRGETWDATAGYRNTFSRCLRLSLMGQHSARFSLPQAIRKDTPYAFMDAAILAEAAMEAPDNTTKENPHWQGTARAALAMALLYEVHRRVRPTMAEMASFWSQPGKTERDIVTHVRDTAPMREVAELAQELLNKEPREASSVLSTMTRQLFLYRDPLVARNTAACDFHLEDFTRHDRWTSLYIVLSPEEEHYLRPFLRMFLRLALGRWLELGPTKHRITLVLDEFHTFGRLQFYADELGVLGGRGIRTLLAVQNVPQLRIYGDTDSITEHCKVRLYFAAQGETTGREMMRQTGTGTATTLQQTWQRGQGWGRGSQQAQQHGRPLLTEGEAMQIPPNRMIIQVAGAPPIWATKLKYWQRRQWRQRSEIPAPVLRGGRP
jgi:type IV secretion system protein VirD4